MSTQDDFSLNRYMTSQSIEPARVTIREHEWVRVQAENNRLKAELAEARGLPPPATKELLERLFLLAKGSSDGCYVTPDHYPTFVTAKHVREAVAEWSASSFDPNARRGSR